MNPSEQLGNSRNNQTLYYQCRTSVSMLSGTPTVLTAPSMCSPVVAAAVSDHHDDWRAPNHGGVNGYLVNLILAQPLPMKLGVMQPFIKPCLSAVLFRFLLGITALSETKNKLWSQLGGMGLNFQCPPPPQDHTRG